MEKSKLMMIVIIALLVLLLATVVGVSFYIMGLVNSQEALDPNAPPQAARALSLEEQQVVSLGEPIVTNLARDPNAGPRDRGRMIRISVLFSYDITDSKLAAELAAKIDANLHIARSIALACIISSTYEDLSDAEGMANLADKIKIRLQEEFETSLIVSVYFDDWLLQ
jgi:flagellar basal body-associated protein FliL